MNLRKDLRLPKWIRIASLLLVLTLPAVAEDESGYALLLQSSPAHGGKILPGNGVFKVQIGQAIPLIAVPQPGYRFLYWLGDVGQTDVTRTSVRVNSPKLIVAVFERERFDDLEPAVLESAGSATGGIYAYNPMTGSGGLWGSNPISPEPQSTPTLPESDPFPVPEENPVPEPMTLLLLGMGSAALVSMRRKRVQCNRR